MDIPIAVGDLVCQISNEMVWSGVRSKTAMMYPKRWRKKYPTGDTAGLIITRTVQRGTWEKTYEAKNRILVLG